MTEAVENNTNTEAVESPIEGSIIGGAEVSEAKAETTEAKAVAEPINYEFTLPEGQELDTDMVEKFKPLFQEANLPQEAAQKLVSQYAEFLPAIAEKVQAKVLEQVQAEFAQKSEQFAESTKKDPEIGGVKLTESVALCGRAIDAFCSTPQEAQAFKAAMNEMGVGNHPEIVRFLTRVGKSVSEGTFVRGGQAAAPKDAATILFGDSTN